MKGGVSQRRAQMSFMPDTALLFADHQLTETGKIAPDALSSRTRIMKRPYGNWCA